MSLRLVRKSGQAAITDPLSFRTLALVQVAAYGACVHNKIDGIQRNACAEEFSVMKKCSQRVLAQLRKGRK